MSKLLFFSISILFFISSTSMCFWYNNNWQYRQQITVSSNLTSSNLSNFPLLVSLEDENNPIFSNAQSDGDDILFTSEDGVTKLSHEIEYYNPTAGSRALKIWVKIPLLQANQDTILYIYYGNPTANNQQDVENVWDSNYVMVQHLQETSSTHFDSTHYHNDGTPMNGVNQNATGKIDGADRFDGIDDFISIADSNSLSLTNQLTVSAWFNTIGNNFTNNYQTVVSKGYWVGNPYGIRMTRYSEGPLIFGEAVINGYWHNIGFVNVNPNQWYYAVITYDGSNFSFYLNGTLRAQESASGNILDNDLILRIGNNTGPNNERWLGYIDEVRISNIARSPQWIEASYNNMNNPSNYLTFGEQETAQPTPTPTPAPLPLFSSLTSIIILLVLSSFILFKTINQLNYK